MSVCKGKGFCASLSNNINVLNAAELYAQDGRFYHDFRNQPLRGTLAA